MLKSELITNLTQQLIDAFPQLTEQAVKESVNALLEYIIQHIAKGGRVEVRGFGSFTVQTVPAGKARNPKTGKTVDMPARLRLRFRAAKQLRLRVNARKKKE